MFCILEVMRGHFVNSKSNKIEPLEFVYKRTKDIERIPFTLMKKSPLKNRRHTHLLNLMYKRKETQVHTNSSSGRTQLFDAVVRDTEHQVKTTVQRSVYVKGALAWNSLPAGIRNRMPIMNFKSHKKHELPKKTLNLLIQ